MYPRLLADIGATNARFCLQLDENNFSQTIILPCDDFADPAEAAKEFLDQMGNPKVHFGAFAVANPILGDKLVMTNNPWRFSCSATREELGFAALYFLNDFTAQALAILSLKPEVFHKVGGKEINTNLVRAVLGPGTGLGVSALVPDGRGGDIALACEGGHTGFAPRDERETAIWQIVKNEIQMPVSAERLMCGSGLMLVYRALTKLHHAPELCQKPADITANIESDPIATETVDTFCSMFGSFCADVVLTMGARGGVYICGGIIPRILPQLLKSDFRKRFETRDRLQTFLEPVPIMVVMDTLSGIIGAANYLKRALTTQE